MKTEKKGLDIGAKSFITATVIIFVLMIVTYILTFIVPGGEYARIADNNGNMILTEGHVLQDEKIWKRFLDREIIFKNNSCELYFEVQDIKSFIEKLERLYPTIEYVNHLTTHSWGQQVIRFYDLDGNLIEVGTPT